MTYVADNSLEFRSIAREVLTGKQIKVVSKSESKASDGTELIPTEVNARIRREGASFYRPNISGATVDQEGLANNYAVEPDMYLALFPTPAQVRRYIIQGAMAAVFVTSLIVTAVVVS